MVKTLTLSGKKISRLSLLVAFCCISILSTAQVKEYTRTDSLINENYNKKTEALSDSITPSIYNKETKAKTTGPSIFQDSTDQNSKIEPKPKDNGYGIFSMFQGNPGKAGLMSLVIPGLGQAYNKRWWKVPVAIAAEVTVIYLLQNNIRQWKRWDTDYRLVLSGQPSLINPVLTLDSVRNIRNAARQNKDYTWIALIGTHIIIAADAFVDRHLIEFDVDDDLSFKASPFAPYPGINIVMTF